MLWQPLDPCEAWKSNGSDGPHFQQSSTPWAPFPQLSSFIITCALFTVLKKSKISHAPYLLIIHLLFHINLNSPTRAI